MRDAYRVDAPGPSLKTRSGRDPALSDLAEKVKRTSIARYGARREVVMVGRSRAYVEVIEKAQKVASFSEPVLILGESGVGKESLAQAIHLLCQRSHKPMVSVNCPQYQEGNLTVSELFGHKKGSFTGASADRQGCFETANGGVIFLDEIGDLHFHAQVMLLRALATGEFQALGSDVVKSVNVRVVAATNRELDQLMVGDEFRHDLFFRLQYFVLKIPPLRDRGEDWLLLADYFLKGLAEKYGVDKNFSDSSLRLLETYPWPGNVRELQSLTTMAYAMSDGARIEPDDFVSGLQTGVERTPMLDEAVSLFDRVVRGLGGFWDEVHKPFLERELNRHQVRTLIKKGLDESGGSYRRLLTLLGLEDSEYQRFMDFLRHHKLKP